MLSKNENNIKDFWQENPCGENLTGKLDNLAEHFKNYDKFRYATEGHILKELDQIEFKDKKVLEIGIGQAADSAQIAKRGAEWNGLDLTEAAINRAKLRFEIENLSFGDARQGTANNIPWPNDTFDVVYSHGVLHHIPDIEKATTEIQRVLKPNGWLVIMLYHKNSLNYYLSILLIRRLLFVPLYVFSKLGFRNFIKSDVLNGHIQNAEKLGFFNYLKADNFIHTNTDGPDNPFSKVYDLDKVKQEFSLFELKKNCIHFLNLRHLPLFSLLPDRWLHRMEARYGWHLWVFFTNGK